jgi:hypothetical protein
MATSAHRPRDDGRVVGVILALSVSDVEIDILVRIGRARRAYLPLAEQEGVVALGGCLGRMARVDDEEVPCSGDAICVIPCGASGT